MTKVFMVRTMSGLTPDPTDERSAAALKGVKIGAAVMVEVTRPRNVRLHRLYWAMVGKIASAVDLPSRAIDHILKVETGHTIPVKRASGAVDLVPGSISFSNMDEPAFREFFERCCRVISMEWLPHMSSKQVQAEVLEMLGITWTEAA